MTQNLTFYRQKLVDIFFSLFMFEKKKFQWWSLSIFTTEKVVNSPNWKFYIVWCWMDPQNQQQQQKTETNFWEKCYFRILMKRNGIFTCRTFMLLSSFMVRFENEIVFWIHCNIKLVKQEHSVYVGFVVLTFKALDYENCCMWKWELVFELSKLSSKINEAFIELNNSAIDASIGSGQCTETLLNALNVDLLAVRKRMNVLMTVVFHLNYLILIIGRS